MLNMIFVGKSSEKYASIYVRVIYKTSRRSKKVFFKDPMTTNEEKYVNVKFDEQMYLIR